MVRPRITNVVLDRIKTGDVLTGYCMGNFASPRLVDHVCRSGCFDLIWFDLEHFDIPIRELAELNMVTRAYPMGTVARFKATDYQMVMRPLEVGMDGIMCSMVGCADEARQIVQWAKFPNPNPSKGEATGMRGWNSGNIDGAYGNIAPHDYIQQQNTETFVIAQIETDPALQNCEEIIAVPGIDALFFGLGDYTVSEGIAGQFQHEKVIAAMKRINAACVAAGKWWGTLGIGREGYALVKSLGCRFISAGGDVKMMNLGLNELVKTFA